MLAAALSFTGMAICVGTSHRLDPSVSVPVASGIRAVVNLACLILLARGSWRTLIGDARPALWARGVFGAASLLAYFSALQHLGLGEAAFLNNTSAVWVALAAPLLLGEPTPRGIWAAILGSLVGMALLVHPRGDADWFGRAAALGSGLTSAAAYLSVRRAGASNPPITVVFWFTGIATVISGGLWAASGEPAPRDPWVWAALAGSGVFATAAQLMMTRAYAIGPAAAVAAAGAAGPLLQVLAGWLVFGEVPDTTARLGIAVLTVTSIGMPLLQARAAAVSAR